MNLQSCSILDQPIPMQHACPGTELTLPIESVAIEEINDIPAMKSVRARTSLLTGNKFIAHGL